MPRKKRITARNKSRNTLEYNRSCGKIPTRKQFRRRFRFLLERDGKLTSRYAIWSEMILTLGPFDKSFVESMLTSCVRDEIEPYERSAIVEYHTNNMSQVVDKIGSWHTVVNQKRLSNGMRKRLYGRLSRRKKPKKT